MASAMASGKGVGAEGGAGDLCCYCCYARSGSSFFVECWNHLTWPVWQCGELAHARDPEGSSQRGEWVMTEKAVKLVGANIYRSARRTSWHRLRSPLGNVILAAKYFGMTTWNTKLP
jgi:hypothetical protein